MVTLLSALPESRSTATSSCVEHKPPEPLVWRMYTVHELEPQRTLLSKPSSHCLLEHISFDLLCVRV